MQKHIAKTFFLLVIFFVAPSFASATPSINTISGAMSNNGIVTINGSSFGLRASGQATPLRFETWQNAIEGQNPAEASNNWWSVVGRTYERPSVTYSNSRIPGQATVDTSMHPTTPNGEGSTSLTIFRRNAGFLATRKVYLNFWMYTDFGNSPLNENIDTQLKFYHIASDSPPGDTMDYVMPQRSSSFWEYVTPNTNQIMTGTYGTGAQTLGPVTIKNDQGSTAHMFKGEGWYNYQLELDQGVADQANGRQILRITGPNYTKYGVSDSGNKVVIGTSPTWTSGMSSTGGQTVYYNGKRYSNKGFNFISTIPPDQDTSKWREVVNHDYLDSLIFWLWSQKRASNTWNQDYNTLISSGSYVFSGNSYEIASQSTFDFTTAGAFDNNPGTIFTSTATRALGEGDSVRRVIAYKTGGKVDYSGKAYQCTVDVLSMATPDVDTAHWNKVFDYPWPSSTIKMFLDSIYVDNSFARIEIGDNPTYANCTHREIQIPTAWSDGEVQFKVNQGTFTNGQAWLFVVDENGNTSAGYPITFAATGDVIAPAAPSGLSVQ